ncbi:hypothetical protein DN31_3326 [Vibrio mimicus]|nr:hypothetical protein DN31_3326 [Vibrio mimicus]
MHDFLGVRQLPLRVLLILPEPQDLLGLTG